MCIQSNLLREICDCSGGKSYDLGIAFMSNTGITITTTG